MSIFRALRISRYSDKECLLLWHTLIEKGLITLVDIKDKDKFDRGMLNRYLNYSEHGAINPIPPQKDEEFEKLCAGYKEDWENHKKNIEITSRTASYKYLGTPMDQFITRCCAIRAFHSKK